MQIISLILPFFLFNNSISILPKTDIVKINKNSIYVNDEPYFIKGICYHPVSKGNLKRSFSSIDRDLELMTEAGINTIRLYEPIDDVKILDKIANAGIKVIISFGYNQNGFYDIFTGTFLDYIAKYRDHKAILIWEFGNEYNYHPEWFENDIQNWYDALKNAVILAKREDQNHPVSTAHGDLPSIELIKSIPELDIWGLNVYRWDKPQSIFKQWKSLSSKPIYLSEAGADSYMSFTNSGFKKGKNEEAQAVANGNIIDAVFDHKDIVNGLCVFSFTDGWWKSGNPKEQDIGGWAPNTSGVPYDGTANEEFWGVVDIDRRKKLAFKVLKDKYTKFKFEK